MAKSSRFTRTGIVLLSAWVGVGTSWPVWAALNFQDALCDALKGTKLEESAGRARRAQSDADARQAARLPQPWKPLEPGSIIIDTNMAIDKLNQRRLSRLDEVTRYFKRSDLRITDRGGDELYRDSSRFQRFREDATVDQRPKSDELTVREKIALELGRKGDAKTGNLEVGGPQGQADREIVTEVFCAQVSERTGPPVFVTQDHGIFLALFRRTSYISAIPEEEIFRNFYPKGFEITIEGRTIRVVPVPPTGERR